MVIGIIGETGSGKTTYTKALVKELKGFHIEGDKVGHTILSYDMVIKSLVSRFGEKVLDNEGRIDRKSLGAIVFADNKELNFLNTLTHPLIKDKIAQLIDENTGLYDYIFLDGAALIEAGLGSLCQLVIFLTADRDVRLERLVKGRQIPEDKARLIISAQEDKSYFMSHADRSFDSSKGFPAEFTNMITYIRSEYETHT